MKDKRTPQKNKKKSTNGKTSTILLVAVFFVGLSVLLYPTISDFQNSKKQSQAIVRYDEMVNGLTPTDYTGFFADADTYNQKVRHMSSPFLNHTSISKQYNDTLNVDGHGMMGYITIDKIKVQLPIYHGTSDAVLNSAVGHVEGSSLPVGGTNTHTVLSAHRGLPSAKLFTNLDKVEIGDVFTIRVLDRTITYQVDQIRIILPEDTNQLTVVTGEDYCTLVTCTPYGINTHRLLVRGTRIENQEEDKQINVITDAYQVDPLIVTPAVAAPILGILLIYLLIKYRKQKDPKAKDKPATPSDTPEEESTSEPPQTE